MRPKVWAAAGMLVILGCSGLVFAVDYIFKSALSEAGLTTGSRAVEIASDGFLHTRRAVFLICRPDGHARVLAKARLAERGFLRVGAKALGEIDLAAWEHRGRPDVVVKTAMTLTSKDWVDTLEGDDLTREAANRIVDGLSKPDADFVAIHAFERGVYAHRTGGSVSAELADCMSR
jgi:hypothetical protein